MKNERMFLKCSICGNIVGIVEDAGPTLVCCGQEMKQLMPNTMDAALEKHVPVAERKGGEIEVHIGSVPHPATEEHHISWVVLAGESNTQRATLGHTAEPRVSFCVNSDESVSVYAYCNLHGLWASEV